MRRWPVLVLAALLALTLSGCKVMQRISEGAYRNAVSDGVVDELEIRGIELRERPSCESPVPATSSVVRPRETYVVTVGGREVLRKGCLGLGCEHPNT